MGLRQMPGNVWWRSWRELPPPAPFADCQATDPDFSWQGQWPMPGSWQTYTDPQSHRQFPVWEGRYVYPGSDLSFIPTWAGGMFEALMANEVVPETKWGKHSLGLADERTVQVQMKYATEQLHYPVWGLSPSSTADDSGGYGGYGAEGLVFPQGRRHLAVPRLRDRGRGHAARFVPRARRRAAGCVCEHRRAALALSGRLRRRRLLRRGQSRRPAPSGTATSCSTSR